MRQDRAVSGRQRKSPTFPDLIRTLVVFAVLIGGFIALLPKQKHDAVKQVDYGSDLSIFARAAGYPAIVPTPVPDGWTVTSFRGHSLRDGKTPSTMHMGMVTAAKKYAALEETDGDPTIWIAIQTLKAPQSGSVVIDGVEWQRYDRKGVVSLARTASGFTTVVTGGAALEELETLIRSLRPAKV